MAYVVGYEVNNGGGVLATTIDATLPAHVAGDLLVVFCHDRNRAFSAITSGWNTLFTQSTGSTYLFCFYKIATSSSETAPTITVSGGTASLATFTVCIRDADQTTPITLTSGVGYTVSTFTSGAYTRTSPSLTAGGDNLLLHACNIDSVSARPTFSPTTMLGAVINVGGLYVTKSYQDTSGASATFDWQLTVNNRAGSMAVVAINNSASGGRDISVTDSRSKLIEAGTWAGESPAGAPSSIATTIDSLATYTAASSVGVNGGVGWQFAGTSPSGSTNIVSDAWFGFVWTLSSTHDLSGKTISIPHMIGTNWDSARMETNGNIIVFADSVGNWEAFRLKLRSEGATSTTYLKFFTVGDESPIDSSFLQSGAGFEIDWADITKLGYMYARQSGQSGIPIMALGQVTYFDAPVVLTGGTASKPIGAYEAFKHINCYVVDADTAYLPTYASNQGGSQLLFRGSLQFGDGSTKTYVKYSAEAFTGSDYGKVGKSEYYVADNAIDLTIYASANCHIDMSGSVVASPTIQGLTIHASSSTVAYYNFAGSTFSGYNVTWKTGVTCDSVTFKSCYLIDAKAATLNSVIVTGSKSTTSAMKIADGAEIIDCSFTKGSETYAMLIETAGDYDISGTTFSGYTTQINVTATTGTVNITKATLDPTPTYTTAGATVNIVSPVVTSGLTLTGLVSGSQVKIFEAGTQTVIDSTTSSGTSFSWSETYAADQDVDYTILKDGYVPIRVAGVTLGPAITSVPVSQQVDRAYQTPSGLTFGTTATVNTGTKRFTLTTASTVQNWYSFLVQAWRTEATLQNVTFPLQANGTNSFTLSDGWEFTSGISYLSRDGMRYTSGGTETAVWAALLSAGVPAGMQVRYQQQDGAGTTNAATTGNIDQLIQVYGDASHGNFDYRAHMVLKVQGDGYDQAEADVVSTYGNLADDFYIVGLAPTANGIAGQSGITGITITDHGASPVTWNSKAFSITIEDTGTHSGEEILQYVRDLNAFNYHDLVQTNGTAFKTVRGKVYGDTGATLKGVRVIRGGNAHPDFNLYTADDGTTYAPPVTVSVTISGAVAGTLIQLYDTANNTQLYLGAPTFPYAFTETYSVDRTIRIRAMYVNGTTAKEFIEANIGSVTSSAPTLSYVVSQSDDVVYNTNAIDGSTVTGITIDDSVDRVKINIAGGTVTWKSIYAYNVYWLGTTSGIVDDGAIITAPDTANYIVAGFEIKNTSSPMVPLTITEGYGRDSVTGMSKDVIDTTGGTIILAPDHVIPYSVGSGLTAGQAAQLAAIESATADIPTAVWGHTLP